MKKRILFLLMSFISLVAVAQQSRTHLIVWSNDGTQVAYAFNEQPKITFSETDLQIKTALAEVNYPLANMARFTYETRETEGVREITTEEPNGHVMCK